MKGLIAVINYEDFYGRKAPSDSLAFVRNYPTDVLLLVLCRVNSTLFHEKGETFECQTRIFREVFNQLDEERKSLVIQHYSSKKRDNNGEGPVYFSDQAVTWRIGHCFRHFIALPVDYDFQEAELQQKVFDSILIANKVYFETHDLYELSRSNLFPSGTALKKLKQCKLYPVIIYTEPVLDAHAVNSFCNDHFQQALGGLKQNFNHVYPLTMINLDFFISYYHHLKNRRTLLSNLIKEYHERVRSGFNSFRNSGVAYVFLNANISFAYFIYKTQPDPGASIRHISEDLNLELGAPSEEEGW